MFPGEFLQLLNKGIYQSQTQQHARSCIRLLCQGSELTQLGICIQWTGVLEWSTRMELLEWNHWNGVKHWSGPITILEKVLGIFL